jgi:hypothetical protein
VTDRPKRTGRPAGYPTLAAERDYETTIIGHAKLAGWRVHAERPAPSRKGWRTPIRGDAGFPDLVLVHRLVGVTFVELKVTTDLTDDQKLWGQALLDASQALGIDPIWRVLYLPADQDPFCQWLWDAPRRAAGIDPHDAPKVPWGPDHPDYDEMGQ